MIPTHTYIDTGYVCMYVLENTLNVKRSDIGLSINSSNVVTRRGIISLTASAERARRVESA